MRIRRRAAAAGPTEKKKTVAERISFGLHKNLL
jgi:hypothetical protein